MFALAFFLLLGIGVALALGATNHRRLALAVAFTVGAIIVGFAILITIGLLFGD